MANLLKTIAVRGLSLIAALGCLGLDTALAAPERRALLIGINEYASPKVVDLRGAVNDRRAPPRRRGRQLDLF